MKAWCATCKESQQVEFRVNGPVCEDLCCKKCDYVIATVWERPIDSSDLEERLENLADTWISDSEDEASCPTGQSRGAIECAKDLREKLAHYKKQKAQEAQS